MKLTLAALAATSLVVSSATAAVTIQNYATSLTSDAFDGGPTDVNNDSTATFPFTSNSVSSTQASASSFADIAFTDTTGVPPALGATVSGFSLEFTSEVTATSNAVDAEANAGASLSFDLVVTDAPVEVFFSNTGSDLDFRFIVNGSIATNATQTQVLAPGVYSVSFADGAGASSGQSGAESNQTNDQTYSLSVQTIPEPTSTALLGLAGLGLLLRRRA